MSLAITYSRAQYGVSAPLVTVETHLSNGLPGLSIVGLPETSVKESKDRVRSAIINSHFEWPARRITINLAPADLPKGGSRFDLAIALGILAASGQIPKDRLQDHEFIGELALTGELRPVTGVLAAAIQANDCQRSLIVANENNAEVALADSRQSLVAGHLLEVCAYLHERIELSGAEAQTTENVNEYPDLADVQGQPQAKRALEIAAAGGHNLLLMGPPGTGKTMLASRLLGVLPEMSKAESLASACIHSLYCDNTQGKQDYQQRPFRAPHHSASAAAMVGGGNPPQPGEVSLAHNGVLFLDELPEFQRKVLEVLREPLECGEIRLSRARHQICYPANFQLIAAMNPCPCGYYGSASQRCRCSPDQVERYRQKISGPLLDRIDIHITVNTPTAGSIIKPERNGESSEQVKQRVVAARQRQLQRQGCSNSELDNRALLQHGALDVANQAFMQQAMERLGFSARAYYRVIKLARTLADLEAETTIKQQHLSEALGYRSLDRQPS